MPTDNPSNADCARFELRDVGIDIAGSRLLKGIDIALVGGDILAVTGPSGTGKTLLLRAMVGLDDVACGSITLRGASPASYGWPAYRRRVMLLPTSHPLLPGTVADNFEEPASYRGAKAAPTAMQQRQLLKQVGLDVAPDRDVATLSTGEQRRMAMARAVWMQPDVLVADEPTNGLDEANAAIVERLLREHAHADNHANNTGEGRVVVVVSHDQALISRLSNRSLDVTAHRSAAVPS